MAKTFRLLASLCAAALALQMPLASPSAAQDMATVQAGTTQAVMKYNSCRMIRNQTGSDILVPLGSPSEWNTGTESFIRWAPDFPGVGISACMPNGGSDASICKTDRFGDATHYPRDGDRCRSLSFRVLEQSSILPITASDGADWEAAITWAANNLGRPASARPSHILPACYTNSNMDRLSTSDSGYVPPGSDFCISRNYRSTTWNSSGGQEDGGASWVYYRVWR